MFHFTPSRAQMLAAASTVFLSVATLAVLHSQPVKKVVPAPDPALQVADDLDAIAQARFQDTTLPVFGTNRMGVPVIGHSLAVRTPAERKRQQRAAIIGRSYVITFLHCAVVPATAPDRRLPPLSALAVPTPYLTLLTVGPKTPLGARYHSRPDGPYFDGPDGRWKGIAMSRLPLLLQGKSAQAVDGDWLVVMRPIRALQKSCLGCHTTAKRGDTLGVMVYGVSTKPDTGG